MEKINELVELVKKCQANCPWCKSQGMKEYLAQVVSEAKELEFALSEGKKSEITDELGDLLWDTIMLVHIAEREGIDSREVIERVNKKILRRKPYIASGEIVTIEQAMKIWKEQKEKEK